MQTSNARVPASHSNALSTVQDRLSCAVGDCEGILTYLGQAKFPEGVRAIVAQAERKLIDTCASLKAMRDPSFNAEVDGPAVVARIVDSSHRIVDILDVVAGDLQDEAICALADSVSVEVAMSVKAFEAATKGILKPEATETATAV